MAPEVAKSLARVSGGLYVITAANKTARGAMLASWVAQASFEPLGLTVAVAKDRAIESLMQVTYSVLRCPALLLMSMTCVKFYVSGKTAPIEQLLSVPALS